MRHIIILLLSLFSMSLMADDDIAKATKQINSIKSSKKYLYAESTTADWQESYNNAKAILDQRIVDWLQSEKVSGDSNGYIAKASNNILEVKTMRGSLYRAFVYVKKSDIMTYSENDDIIGTAGVGRQVQQEQEEPQRYMLTPQEQPILTVTAADKIGTFLSTYASKYGKLQSLPVDDTYYVLMWNDNEIEVYLKCNPATAECYNLCSGMADKMENYKGKGLKGLWFMLK